jgi:hypothetical protein
VAVSKCHNNDSSPSCISTSKFDHSQYVHHHHNHHHLHQQSEQSVENSNHHENADNSNIYMEIQSVENFNQYEVHMT